MVPDHEAIVRGFFDDLWSDGDLACADELLAPHHVHHIGDDEMSGPGEVQEAVAYFRTAFPDLHVELEDVVSDRDRVVAR
jgi:ketosteroid isomerase-like protein